MKVIGGAETELALHGRAWRLSRCSSSLSYRTQPQKAQAALPLL